MSGVASGEGWIILRTAPSRTLRLARSLAEDGFEVWTPARKHWVSRPRSNFRREIDLALLPSFVFAKQRHVIDLLDLAALPIKPRRGTGGRLPAHDNFSVFHYLDAIPVIADRHLDSLRAEETRIARRPKYFSPGDKVKLKEGVGSGLAGSVVRGDDKFTLVCFGRGMRLKIPTSILLADEACGDRLERAPRHRNAAKYLGQTPKVGKALSGKCEACPDEESRESGPARRYAAGGQR